ncbi:hypothetical protein QFZ72_003191 [Bacillus sp. V2I10]|nr:hypothetical protein [Bacillus sp. V2I10]
MRNYFFVIEPSNLVYIIDLLGTNENNKTLDSAKMGQIQVFCVGNNMKKAPINEDHVLLFRRFSLNYCLLSNLPEAPYAH